MPASLYFCHWGTFLSPSLILIHMSNISTCSPPSGLWQCLILPVFWSSGLLVINTKAGELLRALRHVLCEQWEGCSQIWQRRKWKVQLFFLSPPSEKCSGILNDEVKRDRVWAVHFVWWLRCLSSTLGCLDLISSSGASYTASCKCSQETATRAPVIWFLPPVWDTWVPNLNPTQPHFHLSHTGDRELITAEERPFLGCSSLFSVHLV